MSAAALLLVGAVYLAAGGALALVAVGIVLDHRDRAGTQAPVPKPEPVSDPGPALVERAAAPAGVLPSPAPAGAEIVATAETAEAGAAAVVHV